jgi:hypothetical protein
LLRNTRPKHAAQHRREFFRVQSAAGTVVFVAQDGKDPIDKPPIPWEPNCLCWDESILPVDLEAGLPPVNFGSPEFAEKLANAGILPEPPPPKITPPKPPAVVTDQVQRFRDIQAKIGRDEATFAEIDDFTNAMAKLPKAQQIEIFKREWADRVGQEYPWAIRTGNEARQQLRLELRNELERFERGKSVTQTVLSPATQARLAQR